MEKRAESSGYRANHEPVSHEVTSGPLLVHGALPAALRGVLVRNGPNPLRVDSGQHWFLGHGMVHRFDFSEAGVTYSNRWVRTQRWLAERKGLAPAARSFDDGVPDGVSYDDGVANTNVLMHAGRLLALEEAHLPIELDRLTLDTLGAVDFGGVLQGAFTAHPKYDARTGELLFFG